MSDVRFQVDCPRAREVFVVGDFNGWAVPGFELANTGEGRWQGRFQLEPGRYQYKFYAVKSYRVTADAPWGQIEWLGNENTIDV